MVFEYTPLEGEMGELLHKTFTNYFRPGYTKVNGFILPKRYKLFAEAIDNFEVRDDDTWVCSYSKSGTTWTQEMVWNIGNDLNFEGAKVALPARFPYLEFSTMFDNEEIVKRNPGIEIPSFSTNSLDYASKMPVPRFIKSHLPFDLLPRQIRTGEKKPKIIFCVRNPKDTCISFFHHARLIEGFNGTFDEFCTLFLAEAEHYGPYWDIIMSYWKNRNNLNMLVLKYEEMKKDLPSVIKKTADFLEKKLTDDQVSLLADHLSFEKMKANPAVNYEDLVSKIHEMSRVKKDGVFMRSGTTEQWKTAMSPELVKQFDDWIEKHLKGTGLTF